MENRKREKRGKKEGKRRRKKRKRKEKRKKWGRKDFFLVADRVSCSQSHAVSTVIADFKASNDFCFTIGS